MLFSSRHGGRCIYCAFRAQQLRLQSQRTRNLHLQSTSSRHQETLIRYTGRNKQTGRYAAPHGLRRRDSNDKRREPNFIGRAGDASVVRKFRAGRDDDHERDHPARFEAALKTRLNAMKDELKDAPLLEQLRKEQQDDGVKPDPFNKIWKGFVSKIAPENNVSSLFGKQKSTIPGQETAIRKLRETFDNRGQNALDDRIKYEFYAHITGARFTKSDYKNQQALADLRYPSEWFPATRAMQRKIHLHVGPTNSGKTYHALQRLEQAESGVYAGPLRLLAHEVYSRMNAKGKACSLVTGEERRVAVAQEGAEHATSNNILGDMSACTVEMMPLNKPLDVAVIDEIQMMGNADRGWAWTQALLGVKAREVHLCGEERTVPLLREICASVGEQLEIHKYKRLSPLELADGSLDGDLTKLRKGDCVVSFSVMGIHSLRRQIERATGKKVATVYGSLPPETRAQQARLFNDPDNDYDYLVASDAVGMGLNLAIKRIVFEASSKFDGYQHRQLGIADIKQIAGRAGRYRVANAATAQQDTSVQSLAAAKGEPTAPPSTSTEISPPAAPDNTGFVTTLQKFDFPVVRDAMRSDPEPIKTAGLFPPAPVLESFASYFPPSTPFSYILTRLHELSQMHTRFHLCGLKDQVWIADMIEPVQGLTITDRNIICSAPASGTDRELWKNLMPAYAKCIAEQTGGNIVDIPELPLEALEAEVSASREYLRELELLHKGIVTYLWLSYRFAGVFGQRMLAFHVKGLVEEKIEIVLGKFSFTESSYRKQREKREKSLMRDLEKAVSMAEDGDGVVEDKADEDGQGLEVVDEVEEMGQGEVDRELDLREQTSLTTGGDHFGGEEELGMDADVEEGTFEVNEEDSMLQHAAEMGEEKGLEASRQNQVDIASEARPPVTDASTEMPAGDELASSSASDEIFGPEEDPSDLATSVTPETELDDLPRGTQAESSMPGKQRIMDEAQQTQNRTNEKSAGQKQFDGASVPPKHLAHLDVNGSELERNVDSRP